MLAHILAELAEILLAKRRNRFVSPNDRSYSRSIQSA